MGSQLVKLEITPGENEQIELVVKVPEEPRSIIHGVVKDHCDKVIENAVVKLFEQENPCSPCSLRPITHTFTDECGQFLFGPLAPGKHYVIKVWVSDVKVRHLMVKQGDDLSECEIVKEEDSVQATQDLIITRNDKMVYREEDPPTRPVTPQAPRGRPAVRRPRQP
jgi:hypothetical protein